MGSDPNFVLDRMNYVREREGEIPDERCFLMCL